MALALWLALLACAIASADGGFFGSGSSRLVEARPEIPRQRAVLSYRNGEETLLIESTMSASRGSYLWLIPVPSVPDEMRAAGRGSLESVSRILAPRVEDGNPVAAILLGVWVLILWAVALNFAGQAVDFGRFRARDYFWWFLALHLFNCVLWALFFPVFAQAKGAVGHDEAFQSVGTLGSYEAHVLKDRDPAKVVAWLKDRGLALLPKEQAVVEDYLQKGWDFLFAELKSDRNGLLAPHPILVKFKATRPVYPMRLTATGHGHLRLDLYVVADRQADLPGFRTRLCTLPKKRTPPPYQSDLAEYQQVQFMPVNHPDIVPMLWEGCVLTHLRREADASDFEDDLYPAWPVPAESRVVLYTNEGAWTRAALWGLGAVWLAMFVGTTWLLSKRTANGRSWALLWAFCWGTGLVVMLAWYLAADKDEGRPGSRLMVRATAMRVQKTIEGLGPKPGIPFPEAVRQAVVKEVGGDYAYLDLKPEEMEQDVPCGYTVAPAGRGWLVTAYGYDGAAVRFHFDGAGRLVPPLKP